MFPTAWFPNRYYAGTYWPKIGSDAVPNPVPGIQFTHKNDRLDFTASQRLDFTSPAGPADFSSEDV